MLYKGMIRALKTQLLTTEDHDIARAAALLKGGGLVAFPTETVYGLGANALSKAAVENIFKAKGRPSDNPLIVHIADRQQLKDIVSEIPENAEKLMSAFWPGPLTVVMKKSAAIPDIVTAGLDTVGVRVPKNEAALKLLRACRIPIAAPSANISGKPSPTSAEHVKDDLYGKIDAIIDGGRCEVGVESTVIDVSGGVPVLLRPGGVTYEQLTEVLGKVLMNFEHTQSETPRSPGVKYKHYSPKAPVFVVRGGFSEFISENAEKYRKVGIITTERTAFPENCVVKHLGESPGEYAKSLFEHLRSLDGEDVDVIFTTDIDCKGINLATNDRLYRAAGYKIIDNGKNP
ncbi:MAG: Threonylcarbamoyl-AMP synthase [Firmicutes bacterium ADurb.Bin193]|nr:MAG: Threonylcarbamoyl-AMP synthase [Firmicutes bacterium ADurb.Bin193]